MASSHASFQRIWTIVDGEPLMARRSWLGANSRRVLSLVSFGMPYQEASPLLPALLTQRMPLLTALFRVLRGL